MSSRFEAAFDGWTPQAVVFDCDGLLLDTESIWEHTQAAMLERYGVALEDTDLEALVGSTLEEAAAAIARASGREEQLVLEETREQFVRDLGAEIQLMPGARAVLEAAASRVPIGCASNSWLAALEDKLERTGLRDLFGVLEAADTVASPKPAPDMYVAAARALGADPARTLAFEDSPTGARAALEGGLRLIAVPAPGARIDGAALVLEDLEDPELLAWIRSWPVPAGAVDA
ncbi:HAD family hydrolase [Brachybacterium hainanense]|uniref:HAD family hydrolase n=1 Tax=Brachybacterium hainanense TaxID=1541174 RepID=A0ABV6RAG7_9MICO